MREYIVLYGGASVTYEDGTDADDLVVLGIVETQSKSLALDKAVQQSGISPEEVQRNYTTVRELADE